MKSKTVKVWDLQVRLLHWLLVASIAGAWFTREQTGPVHEYFGYAAGAIVALRVLWGFVGSHHARFKHFVKGPRATIAYAKRQTRHEGHNPLGAWMILALLGTVALLSATGWALTTDLLWGYAWPIQIHAAIAYFLLALIALHICGVIYSSRKQRENLIAAMFTGRK